MREKEGREKERLMRGVAVLTPATLVAKVIGLCYKIPLIAIVGVSGMAYFLSAYHVYSMLFVLFASGLPTALSLLVSRTAATGRGAVGRIFSVAFFCFLLLGGAAATALYLFADKVALALAMPEAASALAAIAPALFFSVITGAVKGLFQGRHNMLPTALCEVLEAAGKLAFGVLLAGTAAARGADTPTVAAAAVFGITLGTALSALAMLLWLALARRRVLPRTGVGELPPRRAVLKSLLRVALPITASAAVMSLATLLDTVLISRGLQRAGFAPTAANEMYSSYGNLALPLYNLVPALLAPITLSLLPSLGEGLARGDGEGAHRAYDLALRLSLFASLPAAVGLATFSFPILSMLYGGEQAAVGLAAPLLSLLAVSLPCTVLISTTAAALQAAGKQSFPVWSMLVGAGIKLLVEWVLLALPAVNIFAAPISTFCCNLAVLALNMMVLARTDTVRTTLQRLLPRPLLAATAACLPGVLFYRLLGRVGLALLPQTLLALLLVVLLYLLFALFSGALTAAELSLLPFGKALSRLLTRCKILREVKNNDEKRKTASYP